MNHDSYLTPSTKINSRWITDLDMEAEQESTQKKTQAKMLMTLGTQRLLTWWGRRCSQREDCPQMLLRSARLQTLTSTALQYDAYVAQRNKKVPEGL